MDGPFIVAELSANHLGSFDRAMALVEAAAIAGANAIKTQCFDPRQMADPLTVIEGGPWHGRYLQELYTECWTPHDWHEKLFKHAHGLGMEAFASVFHCDDVDRMEAIGCSRYKISSFEILDTDLIRYAASKGKPIVLSTGMAEWGEIIWAVSAACSEGCRNITALKCTSAYPATAKDANLKTMCDMFRDAQEDQPWDGFLNVGLSDHTLGLAVPVAATVLGASMIERHLTLARADGGPDAGFSSEPHEFAQMVKACREAALALGEVKYGPSPSEESSLKLRRLKGGKRGSI